MNAPPGYEYGILATQVQIRIRLPPHQTVIQELPFMERLRLARMGIAATAMIIDGVPHWTQEQANGCMDILRTTQHKLQNVCDRDALYRHEYEAVREWAIMEDKYYADQLTGMPGAGPSLRVFPDRGA